MNEELDLEELAPWLVGFITLIGGGLRLLLLGTKGLWLDETFSVWLANQPVGDMLHWVVQIDQHPPLYYLLLHAWVALVGDTPYDVRLLSVLFGAGTIPVIYLIGKRLSGVLVGLAAAVFLALSPFNIYYAQEARMYTLLALNAAVAIYALVRLLTDARAARPIGRQLREHGLRRSAVAHIETDLAWVAFVVFSAAAMWSQNTAVFLPLATNLFVLTLILVQRRTKSAAPPALHAPSLANWLKAQIGIFLLWSPWLFFFIRQAGAVSRRFWIPAPTAESVLQTLKLLLNPSAPLPPGPTLAIWTLYALVLCLGLVHYRQRLARFWLLAALFAVPFLGELLVSIWRPIFYDRTLIWTTIPLCLLLAAGVAQLKFRPLLLLALGGFVTLNLFSVGDYFRFYQKEDWHTAAGYVANFAEDNDLVLFNSNFVIISFDYYFQPYEKQYSLQVVKRGVPRDLFTNGILEPEMTESDVPALISLLREHSRVWLVYSHNDYTDPRGLIPQTLAAEMNLVRQRDFYGGQVQLYETRSPPPLGED
ncbi:MAG: glycosyltransferase family 39 protein [Anaerolineales bacterium]|nr:glycosyltransferase family 39 protein [Anaerolineales bacterium]